MRARSSIDFGQRFVASFVAELPFGRGKPIGGGVTGVADRIISGWQLAGFINLQGGFPFTPALGSADPTNSGRAYGLRPNVIGTGKISDRNRDHWFNINDFVVPPQYTIGNAGRNILRGPWLFNQDFSMLKNFHFTERVYLQFRAEYFNLFNVTNLSNPNTNIDLPAVGGKIFGTSTAARIGQFALKLYF
jgi:hypothetical protein